MLSGEIGSVWSAQDAPPAFLDFSAWSLSVDSWPLLAGRIKRKMIAASFGVHWIKGTRRSMQTALDALDVRADITEWFQPGVSGQPHTFTVRAFAGSS